MFALILFFPVLAIEGGVAGSLVYTGMFGGVVWGSLGLSDPVKRDRLWSIYKVTKKAIRRKLLSIYIHWKLEEAKDARVAACQWAYNKMPEAVPGKDATVAACQWAYNKMPEAVPGKDATVAACQWAYNKMPEAVPGKDATVAACQWAYNKMPEAVPGKDATVAACQWAYNKMPEAVPGKDATVGSVSAAYHWIVGTGKK